MSDSALSAQCSSYGSDDCPCVLSTLKECLVCSHLQGKELCDCQWSKYCVFINYLHDKKDFRQAHQDVLVPVRYLNMGTHGYRVFLSAPEPVISGARNLHYVLLKGGPRDEMEIPAVMLTAYPGHGIISLAARPRNEAGKDLLLNTSSLNLCHSTKTAIAGLASLQGFSRKNVLVVADDFGLLLADELVCNHLLPGNRVSVLLGDDLPVVTQKLEETGVDYRVARQDSSPLLSMMLQEKRYDVCVSLGTTRLHRQVEDAFSIHGVRIPHFTSSTEDITGS